MSDPFEYLTVGLLVLSGLAWGIVAYRRHGRDYREHLEPVLHGLGLRFISSVRPGVFKVGPFPRFEVEWGRSQSQVAGIRGEYCEYRIVTFEDREGRKHSIWAMVQFELFKFRRVRWRAERLDGLPAGLLPILESAEGPAED